jgi:SAM-dependent methyltransferase
MPPAPWAEGDNIPWNEPAFSERMLVEHLTQDHDLASRITDTIDAQVSWIHSSVLHERPSRVLDLACGPGLYLNRFGERGHSGVGIDFSPASIRYATHEVSDRDLDIDYVEGDIRETDFGSGFDLVLLLYGQINVFQRHEAANIVRRATLALNPEGALIIEPQTFGHVKATGRAEPSWTSHQTGLFSPEPHLLLTEAYWDDTQRNTTQRFHVIDGRDCGVSLYAMTSEAYTDEEIGFLLAESGLGAVHIAEAFPGPSDDNALAAYIGHSPGIE